MALLKDQFKYRDAGHLFLWPFLGLNVLGAVLSVISRDAAQNLLLSSALSNLVLLAVYVIYTRFCARLNPLQTSGLAVKLKWQSVPAAVVSVPLIQLALIGAMALFSQLLLAMGYESTNVLTDVTFMEYGVGGLIGYILITGLLTGFCEELVFRGGLLPALRAKFSDTAAIFISAACFSIFHMSPDQTVFQFAFGLLLGLITVKTGSVIPAMVMHASNNILSVLMTAFNLEWWLPKSLGGLFGYTAVALGVGFVLLTLISDFAAGRVKDHFLVKMFRKEKTTETVETEQVAGVAQEIDCAEEPQPFEDTGRSANKVSSVMLVVTVVLCAAIWLVNLLTGILGAMNIL